MAVLQGTNIAQGHGAQRAQAPPPHCCSSLGFFTSQSWAFKSPFVCDYTFKE